MKKLSLENYILTILQGDKEYTAIDILDICLKTGFVTNESSVRRAVSNLKRTNKIERTGKQKVNSIHSIVPNNTIRLCA